MLPYLSTKEVDNYFINYKCLPEEMQVPMQLRIYNQDGTLVVFSNTEDYATNGTHYWNLGTVENPRNKYSKEDLYTTVIFPDLDPELQEDMLNAFIEEGLVAEITEDGKGLSVTWGKE
jgi:hypothetical protein